MSDKNIIIRTKERKHTKTTTPQQTKTQLPSSVISETTNSINQYLAKSRKQNWTAKTTKLKPMWELTKKKKNNVSQSHI
jgi:hypothetical protein